MPSKPISHYQESPVYITRDGSTIRELLHPEQHTNQNQSLAEARVPVGGRTLLHRHERSEELYYFLAGEALMRLGGEELAVKAGDSVVIAPGIEHALVNRGNVELVLLCCCAPAYSHADTELLE